MEKKEKGERSVEISLPQPVRQALLSLKDAGFSAWLVGGCVRDALRGAVPHDWDLATAAAPEQVLAVFRDRRVIETGLRHGTVTVLLDGQALEISTLRGASLEEDLGHRDLTINAMAWSPDSGLTDPFGGAGDLAAGRIRAAGDADARLHEDPLRVLRALRFAAVFWMETGPELKEALLRHRPELNRVAPERIRTELEQLLCAPGAAAALRSYRNVAAVVIPELAPMFDFSQQNRHHCFDLWEHSLHTLEAVPPRPVLRWAALLHDAGKPRCFTRGEDGQGHFYGHPELSARMAEDILCRLRFSRAEREQIVLLVGRHDIPLAPEERCIRRWLSRLGEEAFFQLLALQRADAAAQDPAFAPCPGDFDVLELLARKILADRPALSRADLAVNGNDLLALGLKGPEIRAALEKLLDKVLSGEVPNRREALLAELREE